MRSILPLAVLCSISLPAAAQSAGSIVLQTGWLHAQTMDSSQPLHTDLKPGLGAILGIPESFDSPGTSVSISNADTLVLAMSYFVTDHFAVKFEGGYPPTFELSGQGVIQPSQALPGLSVDLGAYEPLATSRQWSPALLLQYYFRDAKAKWRPYLGVGVTYTWFTNVDLNNGFYDALNNTFGKPLALANLKDPRGTHVEADASSDVAPIINAGLSYMFNDKWGLSASVSYVDLKTESTIDIYAGDGTRLSHSKSDIDIDPLVTTVVVSYLW